MEESAARSGFSGEGFCRGEDADSVVFDPMVVTFAEEFVSCAETIPTPTIPKITRVLKKFMVVGRFVTSIGVPSDTASHFSLEATLRVSTQETTEERKPVAIP
jgi:hypothetical protein